MEWSRTLEGQLTYVNAILNYCVYCGEGHSVAIKLTITNDKDEIEHMIKDALHVVVK